MRKKGAVSTSSGSVSREGMVVGCSGDEMKGVGEYVRDSGSILSLQPWIFLKGGYQVDRENIAANADFSGLDGFGLDNSMTVTRVLSPRSVRLGYGFGKRRSSIRSRQSRYSVLPMDSQNCLIPQLYGENFEIEEFVFSPVSPPSLPSRRPFYVTDGSQVISKSSYEQGGPFIGNELGKKSNGVKARGTMVGFSGLPESRKVKRKSPRIHQEMEDYANRKHVFGGLLGTSDGLRLFCMGISLGSVLTMLTRKKEVENLSEMLRCSENLVQDLQDELELKDSLTVKELVSDSSERQVFAHKSENFQKGLSLFHKDDSELNSLHHDVDVNCPSFSDTTIKQSESFSIIEAELQAELERLELSMNVSTLDENLPAFDELDEEQIAEVVQGELCIDKLNHWEDDHDDSHRNSRGVSTSRTPPPNYSVPPTELSLRLHELKQSRLEERIRELEVALAHSQRHLHFMESEVMESLNTGSDMGSSSNQESPTVAEPATAVVQPLCINLSGDALDAYNEAYDEFVRMSEAEEKPPSPAQTSGKMSGDDFCDDDGGPPWALDGYTLSSLASDGHLQEKAGMSDLMTEWESEFRIDDADGGENDDIDDEEGRSLIQQIVEKTRKGSPFVLNVQKMLLSMDK